MMENIIVYYNYIEDSNSGINGSTPGGDVYGYFYIGTERFEHTSSSIAFLKQDMAYKMRNKKNVNFIFVNISPSSGKAYYSPSP